MESMTVDDRFRFHFRNLKQVFLYITDECNLRCKQCLYKPSVVLGRRMDCWTALRLLRVFRDMGAFKLTILGGEATLYGREENHEPLARLIEHSKSMGYSYIRLDTNGQFGRNLLHHPSFKRLDELSFSIDGYDATTNDSIRGRGTFCNALENLRYAIQLGYQVHVTTCAIRQNFGTEREGKGFIEKMVNFACAEGAKGINFHAVLRMGVPMDAWTEGTHIDPRYWLRAYREVLAESDSYKRGVSIRLPLHVVPREEFERYPRYYGYCPAKLGERVLVHANGIIRICSSLLSTEYCVAKFSRKGIYWEEVTNELYRHDLNAVTPCTNQTALYHEDLVPVCFSLKPYQNEPVWKELLDKDILPKEPTTVGRD